MVTQTLLTLQFYGDLIHIYLEHSCAQFPVQETPIAGRGGMILCSDEDAVRALRKMVYDGRDILEPWRDQNISTMGYHYYMTPEVQKWVLIY